ncbi:Zn-dependent hydrolase [Siccirubricoccus deserti]|uniref:Zn-dependent hydrolase n=1 Tax=Siccirubricoccus deserti TaxID=2013562 RepID=A0A9X0QZF3_9PROT|nr:Zn-dependent hydrolase [Siccirubricoccus deserti]MBC4015482.1 Zn-dependent hydrolase [Siccirubricoccus deserti]GGC42059.1 Zn-dependent hydrolase [Siccirubricoccus deserti]
MTSNIPLSGARLWDSLMEMARIGGTAKGGSNRQTLTDADAEGRALFRRWGEACGLALSVDRLGNMVFRREGRDPSRAPVAIGSHLDTQPTGGKFDGVLGVLAGLEIMRALHESGAETEAPLLLVNWTNEEGARFSPPMMGSGGAMGLFTEAEVLAKRAADGAVFGEELRRIGWQGEADPTELQKVGAYLELHIEQGKVLEDGGHDVGIVTHALGQSWFEVVVEGEEAHGGSVMAGRRDALMAAAPLISAVEEIALSTCSPTGEAGRGTVGVVEVYPSSRNIAPSRVFFSVDMRHGDPDCLTRMGEALAARAAEVSAARKVTATVTPFWHSPLTPFDTTLVQRARDSAKARGLNYHEMPTGIGHDAVYLARKVPVVMVFTPCHGGISHNEAESITPEWATAGLQVLADAALATAGLVGR